MSFWSGVIVTDKLIDTDENGKKCTDENGKKCTSRLLSDIRKKCVWKVTLICIQKFEMEIELAILP